MERSHGEEGVEGKYRPGPPAEFRGICMRCLSFRSRACSKIMKLFTLWHPMHMFA